jgi:hypothetical protein
MENLSSPLSTNIKIKIYKIVILPDDLFACKTWSLTLRNSNEEWRKQHKEELHNLYALFYIVRLVISKKDEMGGACSAHEGDDKCIQNIRWQA